MSIATLHGAAAIQLDCPRSRVAARPATEAWGTVRLTRRGRLVILLAVLAVAFVVFTSLGSPAVSTDQTHHATNEQIVVLPGQTLWDIAADIAPDQDTRTVIAEIVDLNALTSAGDIRAGQPLYIPAFD